MVQFAEERKSFMEFLTSACAIIGGGLRVLDWSQDAVSELRMLLRRWTRKPLNLKRYQGGGRRAFSYLPYLCIF